MRAEPSAQAELLTYLRYNDVIPLYGQVEGDPPWPSNPIWYKTDEGYVHSAYVQPVEQRPQSTVIQDVPETGFWAEVCVPIAEARWQPGSAFVGRHLYYETVYRVVEARQDEEGQWWYRLQEGFTFAPGLYVPAETLRYIPPEELAPVAPGRTDKWIQIDLSTHVLTCFEGERAVYTAPFASGLPGTGTPRGKFRVLIKRYTRRMVGGEGDGFYDLPGVPFPVYFTWSGVAIHGTYWHNDYGRPKSHGCVNVPSKDARWIFRWTEPPLDYEMYSRRIAPGEGTPVVVL
ncbi:MAG: L,D-transpeptidase family protein [Anaerolineae bacterium]